MKSSKDRHIYIDSEYCFAVDRFCITLFKRRISQKGQAQFDAIGYFTSLEAMYKHLVRIGLEGCRNLDDIVERQLALEKTVTESIKKAVLAISMNDEKVFVQPLTPEAMGK